MSKKKPKVNVFVDASGEFRWNYQHANGRIGCDSGEGYVEKGEAFDQLKNCAEGLLDAVKNGRIFLVDKDGSKSRHAIDQEDE